MSRGSDWPATCSKSAEAQVFLHRFLFRTFLSFRKPWNTPSKASPPALRTATGKATGTTSRCRPARRNGSASSSPIRKRAAACWSPVRRRPSRRYSPNSASAALRRRRSSGGSRRGRRGLLFPEQRSELRPDILEQRRLRRLGRMDAVSLEVIHLLAEAFQQVRQQRGSVSPGQLDKGAFERFVVGLPVVGGHAHAD